MTDLERLTAIQNYAWTLELLSEALTQHDEVLEYEHNPHLSFRNTAGIHQANAFSRSTNSISRSSLRCHIVVAVLPYWQLQITATEGEKRHMSG
ncbi:hypothetical protein ACQKPE_23110 [Pseudomonas sp. NPDC089554]|uniref:hypothetical protein n=1 Tax=Pseudomonas sp. NPDC089554 TaxID=3390653 RepID=UPI003D058470